MTSDAQVHRLTRDDWAAYRGVRLQALSIDPQVFSSSHARESAWSEVDWQHRLSSPDVAVFGVYLGDRLVGMTGIAVDRDDPTHAVLWGSWLHPSVRGRRFSDAMYAARIDWAVARPALVQINVSHRATNVRVRAAILKHGFRRVGTEPRTWPDGTDDEEWIYARSLQR